MMPRVPTVEEIETADDGSGFAPIPDVSDIPCASLMLGDVEFVSQADGSMLIMADSSSRYCSVDEHQAMQLFMWLSNHLRVKL